MPSWNTQLLRNPKKDECAAVAKRYLDHTVPSMTTAHREFIADVCAWNATKSRHAGDLDWADDVEHWHCAEYAEFVDTHPQVQPIAAYNLANLAFTRVTAWVKPCRH